MDVLRLMRKRHSETLQDAERSISPILTVAQTPECSEYVVRRQFVCERTQQTALWHFGVPGTENVKNL